MGGRDSRGRGLDFWGRRGRSGAGTRTCTLNAPLPSAVAVASGTVPVERLFGRR